MSDPLRTEAASTSDRLGDGDKEARIEQLLLAGLDKYFAGEYEQAINIWTRVVFLERGHSRARAYIERARGAQAERHRESEELLQRGIAAFNSGQNEAARDLITRALEQGGPHDVALVLLERLNRLTAPPAGADASSALAIDRATPTPGPEVLPQPRQRSAARAVLVLLALAAAFTAGMALDVVPVDRWLTGDAGRPPAQAASLSSEPLPIPRPSDRLLARARALRDGGRLHDAIRVLAAIDPADPARPEADRMRGEIQQLLLDAGPAEMPR